MKGALIVMDEKQPSHQCQSSACWCKLVRCAPCRAAAEEGVVPRRDRPGPAREDFPGSRDAKPGQLAGMRCPASVRGIPSHHRPAPPEHLSPGGVLGEGGQGPVWTHGQGMHQTVPQMSHTNFPQSKGEGEG